MKCTISSLSLLRKFLTPINSLIHTLEVLIKDTIDFWKIVFSKKLTIYNCCPNITCRIKFQLFRNPARISSSDGYNTQKKINK